MTSFIDLFITVDQVFTIYLYNLFISTNPTSGEWQSGSALVLRSNLTSVDKFYLTINVIVILAMSTLPSFIPVIYRTFSLLDNKKNYFSKKSTGPLKLCSKSAKSE